MSLILEALNKAEQTNGTPSNYTAPQIFPTEKKTHNKWLLLSLLTAACLISAIVTFLIIQQLKITNTTSEKGTQNTQNMTPRMANTKQAQFSNNQHHIPPYNSQQSPSQSDNNTITQLPIKKESHQTYTSTRNDEWAKQREPGLHHLVKKPQSTNTKEISDAVATRKNERTAITNAFTKPSNNNSDTQNNQATQKIRDINEAESPQLADIEISVHMYSEMPSKRFIYINSTRYHEGSIVSDGIILDEITENGIVLNQQGTRYHIALKQ